MIPADIPQPISVGGEIQAGFDPQNPAPYHRHTGLDSPKIDFNDLLNKPAGSPKAATFVIGPSSNSDSASYDYVTDGTNDDVEIQAAIDALPTNGGRIIFREGTYTTETSVVIAKNGVTLQGQGKGSLIQPSDTNDETIFKLGHASTSYSNCIIRDFYFDGKKASQTGAGIYIIDNQSLTNAISNVEILGCYFVDAETACIKNKGINMVIAKNYFKDWDGYALDLSNYEKVVNNYFTNSGTSATYITDTTTATLDGNEFIFPASYNATGINKVGEFSNNIVTTGSSTGSSCVLIIGAERVVGNTIVFGSSANVAATALRACFVITANRIQGGGRCIYTDSGDNGFRSSTIAGNNLSSIGDCLRFNGIGPTLGNILITGNSITGGTAADDTYSLVLLEGDTTYTVISGNHIKGAEVGNKPKYGIRENGTGDGPSVITGNVVRNCVTAKISTQHPSTEVSHNITN